MPKSRKPKSSRKTKEQSVSESRNPTEGVIALLEDPFDEFGGWLCPGAVVELSDELGSRAARIVTRNRRDKIASTSVAIEVPDFLPQDLEGWIQSSSTVGLAFGNEYCAATLLSARAQGMEPIDEEIRRLQELVFSRIKHPEPWRSHHALAQLAAMGGEIGVRDRLICKVLLSGLDREEELLELNAAIMRGVFTQIAFDGSESAVGVTGIALQTAGPWFEAPCSGIWKRTAKLFPWTAVGKHSYLSVASNRKDKLNSIAEAFRTIGLTSARGVWPATQNKLYSLSDLGKEDRESAAEALEAFLYQWKSVDVIPNPEALLAPYSNESIGDSSRAIALLSNAGTEINGEGKPRYLKQSQRTGKRATRLAEYLHSAEKKGGIEKLESTYLQGYSAEVTEYRLWDLGCLACALGSVTEGQVAAEWFSSAKANFEAALVLYDDEPLHDLFWAQTRNDLGVAKGRQAVNCLRYEVKPGFEQAHLRTTQYLLQSALDDFVASLVAKIDQPIANEIASGIHNIGLSYWVQSLLTGGPAHAEASKFLFEIVGAASAGSPIQGQLANNGNGPALHNGFPVDVLLADAVRMGALSDRLRIGSTAPEIGPDLLNSRQQEVLARSILALRKVLGGAVQEMDQDLDAVPQTPVMKYVTDIKEKVRQISRESKSEELTKDFNAVLRAELANVVRADNANREGGIDHATTLIDEARGHPKDMAWDRKDFVSRMNELSQKHRLAFAGNNGYGEKFRLSNGFPQVQTKNRTSIGLRSQIVVCRLEHAQMVVNVVHKLLSGSELEVN